MRHYKQEIQKFLKGQSGTAYRVFGAHPDYMYGKQGVHFSIYAPNAAAVSLVGSFNDWKGWDMTRDENGVWAIFCDNVPVGSLYKYRITT